MPDSPRKSDRPGQASLLGTASTMGLHMVSGPIVGGGMGWLADHWLGTWPIGAGIGLLLGMAAGFRNVWIDARYLARVNAEADAEAREQRAAPPETRRRERRVLAPDKAPEPSGAEEKADPGSEEELREDEELEKLLASFHAYDRSAEAPQAKSLPLENGGTMPQKSR